MMKKLMNMIFISILDIVNIGCVKEDINQPISQTEIFMGTPISITLYDGGNQRSAEAGALNDIVWEKTEDRFVS